jgi:hypothetical protein
MNDPNLYLLEAAVRLLEPVLDELVFAGGYATGLLISDPAASGIRATRDVDTITEVASYAAYAALSERLRARGLTEAHSEDAHPKWGICWAHVSSSTRFRDSCCRIPRVRDASRFFESDSVRWLSRMLRRLLLRRRSLRATRQTL